MSKTYSLQMEEFLKNIRKLQERVTQLEAQTRILEEEKVDWTGLAQFISSRGNVSQTSPGRTWSGVSLGALPR